MLREARPVRMEAISCCKSVSAFSMRLFWPASISLTELKDCPAGAAECSVFIGALVNQRANGLPHRHTHYIAGPVQVENDDRQVVVPAHSDGSGIHHTQRLREH